MDVAITGPSGLIGSAFHATLAAAGHRPIDLVRRRPQPGRDEIAWHPSVGRIDAASMEGLDAVVNLAGAGIGDRRWTPAYKAILTTSRIGSTRLLAETLAQLKRPPSVLLSGSAIGYYGSRGDQVRVENDPPGDDFLARLCVGWESATEPAATAGVRTVLMRTGVVLSRRGGALPKFLPLFRFGLGGRFGPGTQYLSWITIDDQIQAMTHLLEHELSGPVNLTAPDPVTNAEFTTALARVLGRPSLLPIPAFGPRLILGRQRADALLFDSVRVEPRTLTSSGFAFQSTEIEGALRSVLGR